MIDEETQLEATQAATTPEGLPDVNAPQSGDKEPETDVQASDVQLESEDALPENSMEDDTDYE
ncbi:MAG: hypothetical protein LH660_15170, partial [Phormidesmis sp. CAN_BIN36]|nr:hypothetical protein [Phormidesmis sp. CAN_BIN36]